MVKDRELLKSAYRSRSWAHKVNRMSESQVTAILLRLKEQKKI